MFTFALIFAEEGTKLPPNLPRVTESQGSCCSVPLRSSHYWASSDPKHSSKGANTAKHHDVPAIMYAGHMRYTRYRI